jgi:hypothetical protein
VLIIKEDKVVCFDALLQVLILKGLTLHWNCADSGRCDWVRAQKKRPASRRSWPRKLSDADLTN